MLTEVGLLRTVNKFVRGDVFERTNRYTGAAFPRCRLWSRRWPRGGLCYWYASRYARPMDSAHSTDISRHDACD